MRSPEEVVEAIAEWLESRPTRYHRETEWKHRMLLDFRARFGARFGGGEQKPCPACNGAGRVAVVNTSTIDPVERDCWNCNGTARRP